MFNNFWYWSDLIWSCVCCNDLNVLKWDAFQKQSSILLFTIELQNKPFWSSFATLASYIRCIMWGLPYSPYEVTLLCVLYITNGFGKLPSPCFAVTSTRAAQKIFSSTTDREIGMIPNKLKIHIVKTDTHFFTYLYLDYSFYWCSDTVHVPRQNIGKLCA